jgi:phosphotransferase system HPr (HPr) family protein
MITAKVTVLNEEGMHGRPAARLAKLCMSYEDHDITIEHQSQTCSAKSATRIMMLGAEKGTELTIHVTGQNEEAAMKEIQQQFTDKFGEKE